MKIKPVRKQAKLDIVIPVHGRGDIVGDCLEALGSQIFQDFHVHIVDNDSPKDDSVWKVYEDFSSSNWITVYTTRKNPGFPASCNYGVKKGSAPYILLLNDDVILQPDALEKSLKFFDDPKTGVVGLRLHFPTEYKGLEGAKRPADTIQHVGLSLNIKGVVHHPFVGWPTNAKRAKRISYCWAVTGAYLMTPRQVWKQVGGLDEIYGMGTFEDADYCLKVSASGKHIRLCNDTFGVHYTGATAEHYRIGYPLTQNNNIFMTRWHEKLQWMDWLYL